MGSRGVPVEDGSRIETEYAGEYAERAPGGSGEVATPIAGHPPDPNDGVVRATPPSPGALLVAAGVAALTLLVLVLIALKVS